MEFPHVIHDHRILAAFVFLLLNMSRSSSLPQGKSLPYLTSDVKEVSGKSFDYIVVGGGTAGCPLAATLSERFSVLLIERGGSPYGNPLILYRKYFGFPLFQADEFSSLAQSLITKDGVTIYRGRVLGGTSAINGGFYSRASDDFIRSSGWDDKLAEESYEWVESKIVYIPELTKWQSAVKFGLIEAGILPYNGFSLEHIKGTKIGGSLFDAYGKRHSSADLLRTGKEENMIVLLNATAKDIIFNPSGKGHDKTVHGIRFIKSDDSTNQTYEAYLHQPEKSTSRGDVILSAGALSSPQILLASGIGPEKHIQVLNIPLIVHLEGVGRHMKDSPIIEFLDTKSEYRLSDPPQVVGVTKDFKFTFQGAIAPVSLNATRKRTFGKIASPKSQGKLELNDTDPRQNPVVEFNYLKKEIDLEECVRMVPLLERIASSVPQFMGPELPFNLTSNPYELRKYCKKNVGSFYHFHGGCTLGSVVDNDYKVYGTKGLRVVDGSTFLESPGTNPMATLLMLGRYQGIKILKERESASAVGTQHNP